MHRSVRGALRFGHCCLVVLAIGCGGQTGGKSAASGSGSSMVPESGADQSAGTTGGRTASGTGGAGAGTGMATGSSGGTHLSTGVTAGAVSESSGSSAGMSGYCDQAEVNTGTDPNNCGGCGITCPVSAPSCEDGHCVPVADASTDAVGPPEAGADAGPPPSCAPGGPGMTDCGSGRSGTESCCASLAVRGGTFFRDYRIDPLVDAGPVRLAFPATLSTFRLDKYDVTVGRFRQFVEAWSSGWVPPPGSGKHTHLNGGQGLVDVGASTSSGPVYELGWAAADDSNVAPTNGNLACVEAMYESAPGTSRNATWTPLAAERENLPINCVNWWESYAFCVWDGGFLPSEAEAEYATVGGSQELRWPWGATDPGMTNQYAIYADGHGNCYYPDDRPCSGVVNIAPVGSATLGVGAWGQLDLTGEIVQWNLDWLVGYSGSCNDCAAVTGSLYRTLEGTSFNDTTTNPIIDGAGRPPDARDDRQGFRCARAP